VVTASPLRVAASYEIVRKSSGCGPGALLFDSERHEPSPEGGSKMRIQIGSVAAVLAMALLAGPTRAAAEDDDMDDDALGRAMGDAKVSLEKALSASAREGKPISAKYEVENGKLQLSVYTMKGDKFSEVIVDHSTGKVAKAEPITSGDDLAAATVQKQAMAKAKRSLEAATADAAKRKPGYRAASVTPRLEEGRPVATVILLKGDDDWKTVVVSLESPR
jgi:uncharacterized membrane protein YkoI